MWVHTCVCVCVCVCDVTNNRPINIRLKSSPFITINTIHHHSSPLIIHRSSSLKTISIHWPKWHYSSPSTQFITDYTIFTKNTINHQVHYLSPSTPFITKFTIYHQVHHLSPSTPFITKYTIYHQVHHLSPTTPFITNYTI